MKSKYLIPVVTLCVALLTGCSTPEKTFERGTLTDGVYRNESFNLEFVYPDDLQPTGKESIAYLYGCQPVENQDWATTFELCKTEKNTNYYWDIAVESEDGSKFTGVLIEDISTLDKKPTVDTLVSQQMDAAKKWAGEEVFITSAYEMSVQGQSFQAFTYIATSPSNPDEDYFGMTAIRIEGNYAIIISVTVNSTDKKAFNDVMEIYTTEVK
ncbi:hypothetical protein [Anaerorhabdus sp.]|uniref:hypothetical protein n=1 Tax=Anaerorhabdus sp. TaxID=1872524 RepID=UPI002FC7B124